MAPKMCIVFFNFSHENCPTRRFAGFICVFLLDVSDDIEDGPISIFFSHEQPKRKQIQEKTQDNSKVAFSF
jgi:hypothetical protein